MSNLSVSNDHNVIKSPMQSFEFAGRQFYLKRDDLLSQHFSGNKARKLAHLLSGQHPNIEKVVSYGSVQANSLYSLAALAQLKGWHFDYYTKPIPRWLKENPTGNYAGAIALGATIIEVANLATNLENYLLVNAHSFDEKTLFIPEGGRSTEAQFGINQLANELIDYCKDNKIANPIVMLPSGTGTTSVFLQQALPFQVLTCACVGGDDYLKTQFKELQPNANKWPSILPTRKKYHFGKLYAEFFQIWQQLLSETDIEFDLLYDPLGWLTLLNHLNINPTQQAIIYVHQGGLVGNQSMLPRYQRKYPDLLV